MESKRTRVELKVTTKGYYVKTFISLNKVYWYRRAEVGLFSSDIQFLKLQKPINTRCVDSVNTLKYHILNYWPDLRKAVQMKTYKSYLIRGGVWGRRKFSLEKIIVKLRETEIVESKFMPRLRRRKAGYMWRDIDPLLKLWLIILY